MGHVGEAFTRIALAQSARALHAPAQRVAPSTNCRPADRLARSGSPPSSAHELADDLIAVESADEDVRLCGYVANPSHSRANNRMQYLFLNGRAIRDRALQHALGEAYRGLLLTGRFPIAFLRIEMPAELVDVNVHPTKLEVRFQDAGRLYSQLLGTLRTRSSPPI